MMPFLAQGASVAMEDSWVLAHFLNKYSKDVKLGLKQYQKARLKKANLIQYLSKQNADLYHMRPSLKKWIRDCQFNIATKIPAVLTTKYDKIFGSNVVLNYPINFE